MGAIGFFLFHEEKVKKNRERDCRELVVFERCDLLLFSLNGFLSMNSNFVI